MLNICLCSDWQVNTQTLLQAVCAEAAQQKAGQILVVPDQFSHEMERALCEAGGDRISRYAEVLSFSRLSNRVFASSGGIAVSSMDAGGQLTALAYALEQIKSRLKIFGTAGAKPEGLVSLLDTMDELKSYCVSAERLRVAAAQLTGSLAVKLEELALIMESYDAVCASGTQDPSTRYMRLRDALARGSYAEDKCFWFLGFSDFNGLEYEILEQLLKASPKITAYFHCDTLRGGLAVYEPVRQTVKRWIRLAAKWNIRCELRTHERKNPTPSALSALPERLFGADGTPQDLSGALRLEKAGDAYAECRSAVAEIRRAVCAGLRYREISVLCADEVAYRPILETYFRRCEIPAYFSGKEDILQNPIIRMLLYALRAAAFGMEQEDVLAFLKSGFAPISRDACNRLENYAIVWGISGSAWEKPWTQNPAGFLQPMGERQNAELAELNAARERAVVPLLRLKAALQRAKNTAAQILALYDFLQEIDLETRISGAVDALTQEEDLRRAQAYAQIYEILLTALEQIFGILGASVRTAEEFARLVKTVLSRYGVGTIPATADSVFVGAIEAGRHKSCKLLLLLGAEEGSFPASSTDKGLLSDAERDALLRLGVETAPGRAGKIDRAQLAICNVLGGASQRVFISCRADKPSYLFARLCALYPQSAAEGSDAPLLPTVDRGEAQIYLACHEDALSQAIARCCPELLDGAEKLKGRARFDMGLLEEKTTQRLFGKTVRLSASKIDRYGACRYFYFLQYGLKAKERKQAAFDAPIFGTFVHAVLENTARGVMAEGGFRQVSEARVQALAQRAIEQFAAGNSALFEEKSSRFQYLLSRNREELLAIVQELHGELRLSDFDPAYFELGFGEGQALPPITAVGARAACEVTGFVDRVDLLQRENATYLRVVDYKTGTKNFDYTDLLEGVGLQMFIYLFALQESGKGLPGGVLYFPARAEILSETAKPTAEEAEKERRSLLRRKGIVLDDEAVLDAMEHCGQTPQYLPYKRNRDGTRQGDLADAAQFALLHRSLLQTLASLADQIYSGDMHPNPYVRGNQSPCTYCPYRAVCHRETEVTQVRNRKGVSSKEFWRELERRQEHG